MKKIIIATVGYYGRAIIRKYAHNSQYSIVGIVDSNSEIWGTDFWGHNVYSPDQIIDLDYDIIFIAGRDFNAIHSKFIDELKISPEKLHRLSKTQLQVDMPKLLEKESSIDKIIQPLIQQLKHRNINHWFDYSGLLAIARKQLMAEFSDVEITLLDIDLIAIQKLIEQLFADYLVISYRIRRDSGPFHKNDIISIDISPYSQSSRESMSMEPPVISLVFKKIIGPICFSTNPAGNIVQKSSKYFLNSERIEYNSSLLNVPVNSPDYLRELYGDNWEEPADYWDGN